MKPNTPKPARAALGVPLFALGIALFALNGFGGLWPRGDKRGINNLPRIAAAALPSDELAHQRAIQFLTTRVARDPDDFRSQNMLAGRYLQRLRETSDVEDLSLALRAAHASLRAVDARENAGGLTVLVMAEQSGHEFGAARQNALRLTQLLPTKSGSYALLGDALLELGDYDGAAKSFARMEKLGGGGETRLARLDTLRGAPEKSAVRLSNALALALDAPSPNRETVAWCRWQLGETAFSVGDIPSAENFYNDALTTYPHYFRALASLGRARAALGDLPGAIENYEKAVAIVPDPAFLSALGDLYQLSGRPRDAAAKYRLVEVIGHLSAVSGALYNRQLALFYADHDLKPQIAYGQARREYALRRDIYGADALAWTALKAGHLQEAQTAIKNALRLGTRDAKLFYHAGMIARAAGDSNGARDYLQRTLDLNAHFDPLQAEIARKALAE